MNKAILFLSFAVTVAGLYFIVFKGSEVISYEGDVKPTSNTTSLTKNVVSFKVSSSAGRDLYIQEIEVDCFIMPPAVALRKSNEYTLTGDCLGPSVSDGTVDLIVTYKTKGDPKLKQQALKIYLK